MAQRITLRDIYLGYDYKTYDTNSKTIPIPYFPKDDISTHKYALTYKEWKAVILCFLKHLVKYLLTGKEYELPFNMGKFRLRKYKPKKKGVNFPKTKELYGEINKTLPKGQKKVIHYMNHHTHGFRPFFMWDKVKGRMPFKWHWKLDLSRRVFKKISDVLYTDVTVINKLHQK